MTTTTWQAVRVRVPRLSAGAVLGAMRRQKLLTIALGILAVMIFLAAVGPIIAPHDPEAVLRETLLDERGELILNAQGDPRTQLANLRAPSGAYWFGTDEKALDVFSRTISAPRVDLVIAIASTIIGLGAGSVLGLVAGYAAGRGRLVGSLAEVLTRFMDIIQAFPVFIVALALVAVIGSGQDKVIYVLSFLFTPIFFRYVRAETLLVRELTFVEAERAVGNPTRRIMFNHILPNSVTTATVQGSAVMGYAILLTAGLSFVGAGVAPPTPEWGAMIRSGVELMQSGQWWTSVFPGITLGLTVFSLAVIGESIRVRWRGSGLRGY